jgi:hypothetical protein
MLLKFFYIPCTAVTNSHIYRYSVREIDALQRLLLSSQRRRVFIVFQLNNQLRLWQIEA